MTLNVIAYGVMWILAKELFKKYPTDSQFSPHFVAWLRVIKVELAVSTHLVDR